MRTNAQAIVPNPSRAVGSGVGLGKPSPGACPREPLVPSKDAKSHSGGFGLVKTKILLSAPDEIMLSVYDHTADVGGDPEK